MRYRTMPKSVILAVCTALTLAGCAAEQGRSQAQAKLVITKALYGALPDGPALDVTDKVAAMVKNNALRVDASNDLFGDPADGRFKRLRLEYTLGGVAGSKTVGEDETLTLPADEKPLVGPLVVVEAVYGDLAGGQTFDVTRKVAGMVTDNTLTVVASTDTFDDPAPGVWKRLRVHYTIGGVARTRTVGEDRKLVITGNAK